MEDIFNTEVNSSKLHNNILHKYLILNDTNFCPSLFKEKGGFFRIGVKVRVIDADIKSNLAEELTDIYDLPSPVIHCWPIE